MNDAAYLSAVIGKDQFVTLDFDQFQSICKDIERDPELIENLQDFRVRWIAVNEGDDPLAFADLPDLMPRLYEIVERHVSHPEATSLTVLVLMRYLTLR